MCRGCGVRHNSYELDPSSGTSQDANLDAAGAAPFYFGARSTGRTSPIRGRSVKDCEEQLNHLKKENFSLKLRIYFLEERMTVKGITQDKEKLAQENVQLKVEVESLKKELFDKHALVRQASKLVSTLESQHADQISDIIERNKAEQSRLKERVDFLEKEVSEYADKVANAEVGAASDLTLLADLAFGSASDEVASTVRVNGSTKQRHHQLCNGDMGDGEEDQNQMISGSSKMKGVFSLDLNGEDEEDSDVSIQPLQGRKPPTKRNKDSRIEELEARVKELEDQVVNLEDQLVEKERTSEALQEDLSNLKKQLEDREEKLSELETDVNEKDQKVDQLMMELETRHREIQAKDNSIQNLHLELERVEPAIEVKVQEVVERDRIIEEKIEQLQQQNRILVEIQITLDERQKQKAELEASLQDANKKIEKLTNELYVTQTLTEGMAKEMVQKDNTITSLKQELKKRDKKIKDLIAELKEATDMLKKAKWEAETSGGEDGVKEMVEEENERLWAQLEQFKSYLAEKENALKVAQKVNDELLLKLEAYGSDVKVNTGQEGEVDSSCTTKSDQDSIASLKAEIEVLNNKIESRDKMLNEQLNSIQNLKVELEVGKKSLKERQDELYETKNNLAKKANFIEEFLSRELQGRSSDLKDLQSKLFGLKSDHIDPLEILKLLLAFKAANGADIGRGVGDTPKVTTVSPTQMRSNSLSQLKDASESGESSPKPERCSSFGMLENALYAHLGQKVYNTNQTFNTYVIPSEGSDKDREEIPTTSCIENIIARMREAYPDYVRGDPLNVPPDLVTLLKYKKDSSYDRKIRPEKAAGESVQEHVSRKNSTHASQADTTSTAVLLTSPPMASIPTAEHLAESVGQDFVDSRVDQPCGNEISSQRRSIFATPAELPEQNTVCHSIPTDALASSHKEPVGAPVAVNGSDKVESQISALKSGLENTKKEVTVHLLKVASMRYMESLNKCKNEIRLLQQKLVNSNNAAQSLKSRLDEMSTFLEKILDMEKRGLIDLSSLSVSHRASLNKTLSDSKLLCHTLQKSMLADDLLLETVAEDGNDVTAPYLNSRFSLLPEEVGTLDLTAMSEIQSMYPEDFSKSIIAGSILDFNDTVNLTGIDVQDADINALAEKLTSHIDAKATEIDSIASKINHLNGIILDKDATLLKQDIIISKLKNEVDTLKSRHHDHKYKMAEKAAGAMQTETYHSDKYHQAVSPNRSQGVNGLLPSTIQMIGSSNFPIEESLIFSNKNLTFPPSGLRDIACSTVAASKHLRESTKSKGDLKSIIQENLRNAADCSSLLQTVDVNTLENADPSILPSLLVASPSESEAWSEPDRNVSLARIGIDPLGNSPHDRSLSRNRTSRSNPFTSESDVEANVEDVDIGSPNQPASVVFKGKRRSEVAEIKRLSAKLKNVEQLNQTLNAELHIYQSLNNQMNMLRNEPQLNPSHTESKQNDTEKAIEPSVVGNEVAIVSLLSSASPILQDIRSLRKKLEEAMINNDLLRDQLEAALAGYLNEESRNISSQLAKAQQELKEKQEEINAATNTEQTLREQLKEECSKAFDLSERLAERMAKSESLEKELGEIREECKRLHSNLEENMKLLELEREQSNSHNITINTVKSRLEEKELELMECKANLDRLDSKHSSLRTEFQALQNANAELKSLLSSRKKAISDLEQTNEDYESKFKSQEFAIAELCKSVDRMKQAPVSFSNSLQAALKTCESKLKEANNANYALLTDNARLNEQLESSHLKADVLRKEVGQLVISKESSLHKQDDLVHQLKLSQLTIEDLESEKTVHVAEKKELKREIEQYQGEVAALKARLDYLLCEDGARSPRAGRELARLREAYDDLEESYNVVQESAASLKEKNSYLEEKLFELQECKRSCEKLGEMLVQKEQRIKNLMSQLEEERAETRSLHADIHSTIEARLSPSYRARLSSNVIPSPTKSPKYKVADEDKENWRLRAPAASNLDDRRTVIGKEAVEPSLSPRNGAEHVAFRNLKDFSTASSLKDSDIGVEFLSPSKKQRKGISVDAFEVEDEAKLGGARSFRHSSNSLLDCSRNVRDFSNVTWRRGDCSEDRLPDSLSVTNQRSCYKSEGLCFDPGHNRMMEERSQLIEENQKLRNTVLRSRKRRENVEKAICRELTLTQHVLKQASTNLSKAKYEHKGGRRAPPPSADD